MLKSIDYSDARSLKSSRPIGIVVKLRARSIPGPSYAIQIQYVHSYSKTKDLEFNDFHRLQMTSNHPIGSSKGT